MIEAALGRSGDRAGLALVIWVLELIVGWALVFVPDAFDKPGEVGLEDRLVFAAKAVVGRSGNTPAH